MDTDTQVLQDVIAELKANPVFYNTKLSVVVRDGIVTIAGRVNVGAEHKAIERIANRVTGIRTLVLEIRVAAVPDIVIGATSHLNPELT